MSSASKVVLGQTHESDWLTQQDKDSLVSSALVRQSHFGSLQDTSVLGWDHSLSGRFVRIVEGLTLCTGGADQCIRQDRAPSLAHHQGQVREHVFDREVGEADTSDQTIWHVD